MRSVNQTAKALSALVIALVNNEKWTTEKERESPAQAVFCAVMQPERTSANSYNERTVNADTVSNSR